MVKNSHLIWQEESRREIFSNKIIRVRESRCRSPEGGEGVFTVLDSPDWVIVIPVIETAQGRDFLLVRQWRHGARELSLEFPGGVTEPGETMEEAALRELREETAFQAGHIIKLGEMSPNPAIMSNQVHFFLAEDLQDTGAQRLDADEYVDVERLPAAEVIRNLGKPPYIHALMAAALALYLK